MYMYTYKYISGTLSAEHHEIHLINKKQSNNSFFFTCVEREYS